MAKQQDTLIARDAKGKIRRVDISLNWSDDLHAYVLERSSGLLTGKQVVAPVVEIKVGKAKRTVTEQAVLQYNSELKKYLDKGYKKIQDLGIENLTLEAAEEALPEDNTDQSGMLKPQLAKVFDFNNAKMLAKTWLASYKHDGVRCLLYWKDGEVHTASRGGQDYDIAAWYIREDPYVISLLKDSNLILDGELYIHGKPLSFISGLCRRDGLIPDHELLRFHCYDIVDKNAPATIRVARLGEIKRNRPSDSKLIIVDHVPVTGKDEIMKLHDQAISDGYEGLVLRDPNATYKPGGRTNAWLKVKLFSDDEYEILGLVDGLRDEDMCFLMRTPEGYEFKAKPTGDRELKQWYREHIDELIGKLGTVKHFGMTTTDTPVPNLPVFKSVRLDKDM